MTLSKRNMNKKLRSEVKLLFFLLQIQSNHQHKHQHHITSSEIIKKWDPQSPGLYPSSRKVIFTKWVIKWPPSICICILLYFCIELPLTHNWIAFGLHRASTWLPALFSPWRRSLHQVHVHRPLLQNSRHQFRCTCKHLLHCLEISIFLHLEIECFCK